MSLELRWITPQLAVAPQLTPEDMADVAAAGFHSVICNRPDLEGGPDQPGQEAVAQAASLTGLRFAFHPVPSGGHTPEQALEMGRLLAELPKPILAYCRSGNRCMALVGLAAQLGAVIPQ